MNKEIVKLLFRRDTLENWEASNVILALGEPAIAFQYIQNQQGEKELKVVDFKVGDGKHKWSELNDYDDEGRILQLEKQVNGEGGILERLDTDESSIETLQTDLSTLNGKFDTLDLKVDGYDNRITTAEGKISTLEVEESANSLAIARLNEKIEMIPEIPVAPTLTPSEEKVFALKCLVSGSTQTYVWEEQKEQIIFKVGNTAPYSIYEADNNMTWAQFIASNYNRENVFRLGDVGAQQDPTHVYNGNGDEVTYQGTPVIDTDTITATIYNISTPQEELL